MGIDALIDYLLLGFIARKFTVNLNKREVEMELIDESFYIDLLKFLQDFWDVDYISHKEKSQKFVKVKFV